MKKPVNSGPQPNGFRSDKLTIACSTNSCTTGKKRYVSSIISWFGTDFGKTQVDQLKSLAPYFAADAKKFTTAGGYRIAFLEFDWNLNEQN